MADHFFIQWDINLAVIANWYKMSYSRQLFEVRKYASFLMNPNTGLLDVMEGNYILLGQTIKIFFFSVSFLTVIKCFLLNSFF